MVKLAGTILIASLIIRALAAQLVTIDVAGVAGLMQTTGSYLFGNGNASDSRSRELIVPYNPETGRVARPAPRSPVEAER